MKKITSIILSLVLICGMFISVNATSRVDIIAKVTTSDEGDGSFTISFASNVTNIGSFGVKIPYDVDKFTLSTATNTKAKAFNSSLAGTSHLTNKNGVLTLGWMGSYGLQDADDEYVDTEDGAMIAPNAEGLYEIAKVTFKINKAALTDRDYENKLMINFNEYTFAVLDEMYSPTELFPSVSGVYFNIPDTRTELEGLVLENKEVEYNGEVVEIPVLTGADAETTVDYKINGGDVTEIRNAGTYTVEATAKKAGFKPTVKTATVVVNKKPVTLTVNSATKVCGEKDPAFETVVDGLVGGDTLNYTVARTDGENVGDYEITAMIGRNPNYEVEVVSGTLTITPQPDIIAKVTTSDEGDGSFTITFASTVTNVGAFGVKIPYDVDKFTLSTATNTKAKAFNSSLAGSSQLNNKNGVLTLGWMGSYGLQDADDEYVDTEDGAMIAPNAEGLYEIASVTFSLNKTVLTDSDYENELNITFNEYTFSVLDTNYSPTEKIPTEGMVSFNIPDTRTEIEDLVITPVEGIVYTGQVFDARDLLTINTIEGDAICYETVPAEVLKAGTYKVIATVKRPGYRATSVYTDVVIAPRPVTIKVNAATKVCGEADPEFTSVIAGNVAGDYLNIKYIRDNGEDIGKYTIMPTISDTNYELIAIPGTLTITPQPDIIAKVTTSDEGDGSFTITFASTVTNVGSFGVRIPYDANKFTLSTATNTKAKAFNSSLAGNSQLNNNNGVLTLSWYGSYGLQNADDEYVDTEDGAMIAPNAEGLYEIAKVTFSLNKTVLTDSDYENELNITFNDYTFSVLDTNYSPTEKIPTEGMVSFNIPDTRTEIEDLVITPVEGIVYTGQVFDARELFTINTIEGDVYCYETVPAEVLKAGTYKVIVTVKRPGYKITEVSADVVIGKKNIEVTMADKIMTYGDKIPEFTHDAPWFIEIIPTVVTNPEVGLFEITATAIDTTGNYNVTVVPGTLTVEKKAVTLTVDAKTKVYGEVDPELTAVEGGLVGADTLNYTLAREDGEDAGDYEITAMLGGNPNYEVEVLTADLTITKKPVTVTVEAATKVYGDADPEFTSTNTEIKEGDDLGIKYTRVEGENVGEYAITPAIANTNYELTAVPAELTITKRPVILVVDAKEKVVDEADPKFTAVVGGLVGADMLEYTLERETGENIGAYEITAILGENPNYEVEVIPAVLTIKPKQVKVVFKDYDGAVYEEKMVEIGKEITVPESVPEIAPPYTFDKWENFEYGMKAEKDIEFLAISKYMDFKITVFGVDGEETGTKTVTYNDEYSLEQQEKEEYELVGYFTEKDGKGIQLTDEKGVSLKPYNLIEDINAYPYFLNIYNGEFHTPEIETEVGEKGVTIPAKFATLEETEYLLLTIELPETFSEYEIIKKDFEILEIANTEVKDGITYIDIVAKYAISDKIPRNETIVPFELKINIPTDIAPQDVVPQISSVVLLGEKEYIINTVVAGTIKVNPKLAESIAIEGPSSIEKKTQYTAIINPDYTTNKKVKWTVSDESVASITEDGILTPLKNGTIELIAETIDGSNKSDSISVDVIKYSELQKLDIGSSVWNKDFDPETREYIVYVDADTEVLEITAGFSGTAYINGSLMLPGYKRNEKLTGEETNIEIAIMQPGCSDGKYTIKVIKAPKEVETDLIENDGQTEINISLPKELMEKGKIYVMVQACYNNESKVKVKGKGVTADSNRVVVDLPKEDLKNFKVLFWESLASMKPVYQAYEKTVPSGRPTASGTIVRPSTSGSGSSSASGTIVRPSTGGSGGSSGSTVDYATENAEMLLSLNSVKSSFAVMEFTEDEQEIVDAILTVCDDALIKSAEVILTNEYIRETYADTIAEVQTLLNALPEDAQNDFSGKVIREVEDEAYDFLLDFFFPEE